MSMIKLTDGYGQNLEIYASDIEAITQFRDGDGCKIITKSGKVYEVRDSIDDIERKRTMALALGRISGPKVGDVVPYASLTLRDQFAMAALPACVGLGPFGTGFSKQIALDAYKIADYMLAVRAEEGGES